ncbi:MAG: hypothetical protein Q7T32_04555 [Moraxellaceae bacterium]|nr:hypothetical protein [Moraxellaceae bacterium]
MKPSIQRFARALAGATLLLCTSTHAADPSLRFDDNFSTPGNWADFSKPHSTLAVSDGRLKITRSDGSYTNAEQPVSVRPAARWRATVDLTFTDYSADDKKVRGGLSVSGPLDQRFYVMLDPEGDVIVLYYDGNEWVDKDPLPYTRATGAKPGKNARNTLSIERESGYFRIYVNGVHVGRTRIIDFTPRKVGIVLKSVAALTAEFDNLRLDELGIDTRFSRLINNDGTPGATNLLVDYFDRKRGQKETWLVTDDENRKAEVRDGRYLLTSKKDGQSTWATSNATPARSQLDDYTGSYAGYQISALIAHEAGDSESGRGIMALADAKQGDEYRPYVVLQVSGKHFRVVHSDGAGTDHKLVGWTETPSLNPKGANRLNLTELADGRLLVFINSDYQMTLTMPQYFRMTAPGVYISGQQTISVDEFYAREI